MRIALVSPYSWTYPGGVTRHIEALSEELIRQGHDARVLSPFDPPDQLSARLHRGARPVDRETPEGFVPLGRTVGYKSNGSISNMASFPSSIALLRTELARGGYDVVHVHEPVTPLISWDAMGSASVLPLVGTFHTYGTKAGPQLIANGMGARRRMNRLGVRIAVSEAAEWTARRFYGGRYKIIPNGVHLPDDRVLHAGTCSGPLNIVFIGRSDERKGLPILLRAFEALREHVDATLTLVGVTDEEVEPLLHERRGIRALGFLEDDAKHAELRAADVLCAPSLGGESFGMVLTEAFAEGTPVIASDIAGYRDVVRHGIDGLLVPHGDATALASVLRDVALDRAYLRKLGEAAARHAERYAWPKVAAQVVEAYEEAVALPRPAAAPARAALAAGFKPTDGLPPAPARRLPSIEPPPLKPRRRGVAAARRLGIAAMVALMAWLSVLAISRIGLDKVGQSLLDSDLGWVLVGFGLMSFSMVLRAVSWRAILSAAMPWASVGVRDAFRGTAIGVLMSATLPARLGEPARALVVARRVGRPRESFPAVLGTLVSQTLLNIVALLILGTVMISSVDLLSHNDGALLAIAVLPLLVLTTVLAAPALLRSGLPTRSKRIARWLRQLRAALSGVRSGLRVFRSPKLGSQAALFQLAAWGVQWLACYALLVALGLDHRAGMGAAAAVLFAVNVTAVLPATPSNLGIFQAACVAVLHGAYGVGSADALGYGIVLQAVEIATAIALGTPALLTEGLSWKDIRTRTMHAAPVQLPPLPARSEI
ncbi:MAG: lysylphosphatidylglycerol synthase domain-containing protein [Solirubrobacteraceae bacterium]